MERVESMVSRRNFLSITLMMATLFFLFQFSQVVKEQENDYDTNEYVNGANIGIGDYWGADGVHFASGDFVVYVGSQNCEFYRVVKQWCQYTKRNLVTLNSMSDFSAEDGITPEIVFVNAEKMFLWPEVPIARKYAQKEGVSFVLSNLPSPTVVRQSSALMEFMGIAEVVEEEVELSGVHLFGGFMLGGEAIYEVEEEEKEKQDLNYTVPWYRTGYNTKTFLMGMLDEEWADRLAVKEDQGNGKEADEKKLKNEQLPALVWRNSVGEGKVYTVNDDYMQGALGMGILSGIMADLKSYELYPVVNAQNVTVANLGGFSKENQTRLNALYSRDQAGILHDILLPDLRAMMEQCGAKPTYFLSPQYNYDDDVLPSADNYVYYMQQIKEHRGEAGWSMDAREGTSPLIKVEQDAAFQQQLENRYEFSAFYMAEEFLDAMPEVQNSDIFANTQTISIRRREDGELQVLSYYQDGITLQSITNYADKHTYSDDLRLKAVETVFGYANVLVDLNMVLWPKSEDERWERLGEKIAANLDTYWGAYSCFEPTTLSESDARLRTFLNMDYVQKREGNVITIEVLGTAENVWFVLRTHGEKIASVQGGSYQKIEEDAYLICAQTSEVKLNLKKN